MKPEKAQNLLASCLEEHRLEIITRWKNKLSAAERFLLFRMTNGIHHVLTVYFQEILGLLNHGPLKIPSLPSRPFPMDGPVNEVLILLKGEDVVMRVLKKHRVFTDKMCLAIRREVNQVFHEAIRSNCAMACDCCRWAINENMEVLEKLEKARKEASVIQLPHEQAKNLF